MDNKQKSKIERVNHDKYNITTRKERRRFVVWM